MLFEANIDIHSYFVNYITQLLVFLCRKLLNQTHMMMQLHLREMRMNTLKHPNANNQLVTELNYTRGLLLEVYTMITSQSPDDLDKLQQWKQEVKSYHESIQHKASHASWCP